MSNRKTGRYFTKPEKDVLKLFSKVLKSPFNTFLKSFAPALKGAFLKMVLSMTAFSICFETLKEDFFNRMLNEKIEGKLIENKETNNTGMINLIQYSRMENTITFFNIYNRKKWAKRKTQIDIYKVTWAGKPNLKNT